MTEESWIVVGITAALWVVRETIGLVAKIRAGARADLLGSADRVIRGNADGSGGYPAVQLPNEELATKREVVSLHAKLRDEQADRAALRDQVHNLAVVVAKLEATIEPVARFVEAHRSGAGQQ